MPEPVTTIIFSAIAAAASLGDVALSFFGLCMSGYCRSKCCNCEVEHFSPDETDSRHSAADCEHATPLQIAPITQEVEMIVDKPLKTPVRQTH